MALPAPTSTKIRFGAFELDTTSGELRKAGILLKLQPQPFRVLLLLIERAGQVVSREEIRRCLWTDSTFVDFEHGINFSINQIRGALADNAEHPRYIETIPRRGYRFVGTAEQIDSGGARTARQGSHTVVATKRRYFLAAIGSVVIAAVVGWHWHALLAVRPVTAFENFTITRVTNTGRAKTAAISPDGKYLLIVAENKGKQSLWLRNVPSGSDTQVIAPTDALYSSPAFSPDGNYFYFFSAVDTNETAYNLLRSPVLGGPPQVIVRNIDHGITFSPDGKRMAYLRSDHPEIRRFQWVTANIDGTDDKILSTGLASEGPSAIAWSPDGKYIASTVTRLSDALSAILLLEVASARVKTLARFDDLYLGGLVWLRDSRDLLVTYQEKRGFLQFQIGVISYPGGQFRAVTKDANTYGALTVSVDGKTLATVQHRETQTLFLLPAAGFGGDHPAPAPAQNNDSELFGWAANGDVYFDGVGTLLRISPDGSNKTTLLNEPDSQFWRPTGCPGGRYVVFGWADHHGSRKINLWRIDADGSNPKQLTNGTRDILPHCSPDGKWVYYYKNETAQIMRVAIDGGSSEVVPGTTLQDFVLSLGLPSISRDGRVLAFRASKGDQGSETIVLVNLNDGKQPTTRMIVPNPRISGWQVGFTPDGNAVVYPVLENGVENLWLQPLNGSSGRRITNFQSDSIQMFEFSPDGKTLGVLRSHSESDVVLLRDTGTLLH